MLCRDQIPCNRSIVWACGSQLVQQPPIPTLRVPIRQIGCPLPQGTKTKGSRPSPGSLSRPTAVESIPALDPPRSDLARIALIILTLIGILHVTSKNRPGHMLTFSDSVATRHCDGLSRRSFLKAGFLGIGSLTLADLLKVESQQSAPTKKAFINIHLDGGPPQMDMIDPKPEAPREFRGEFDSIRTVIPGFHVSELMPKTAQIANQLNFIRSLVGAESRHDAFQCLSGFGDKDLASIGGRPAMGSILTKLYEQHTTGAPAYVDLLQGRALVRNSARPGFLGPTYTPFRPDISHLFHRELEPGMVKELDRLGKGHQTSLRLGPGIDAGRLDDRVQLLNRLDRVRRKIDSSPMMAAMDAFTQQAFSILTSGKIAAAMDLSQEDPKVVARYTPPFPDRPDRFYTSEGPDAAKKLLLARRLIEAGVRCVSVSLSDFDTHSKNFSRMKDLVPIVDHALHALVTDLSERGMLDEVTIVAWGEFGRTPTINTNGGRDHWPRVAMAILAGGGMVPGQVIGATDRYAGEPTDRPVHYQDVLATVYHNLGINARHTTLTDTTGRPQYLLDKGSPIRELVG